MIGTAIGVITWADIIIRYCLALIGVDSAGIHHTADHRLYPPKLTPAMSESP